MSLSQIDLLGHLMSSCIRAGNSLSEA